MTAAWKWLGKAAAALWLPAATIAILAYAVHLTLVP